MNYLSEYYKNKCNELEYKKNLLILEIKSSEQSSASGVQVTSGAEDFSSGNGIDYTNYGLGDWLARLGGKLRPNWVDEGLVAIEAYIQRLFGFRNMDEVMEIIRAIPNYQVPGVVWRVINGIRVPYGPSGVNIYGNRFIPKNPLLDATWPLTRSFGGQQLPTGVLYDQSTGLFWVLEAPSATFPLGRPMFFHPNSQIWSTYIGPAAGNPFGFNVIINP
jgi:hypothetical protein